MYGLGIRIGYYLQWSGGLLAAWICPREVPTLRLTRTLFVASTFLALLTQVPEPGNLEVVEIYITLLFTFGSGLYLLPIFIWRLVTKGDPRKDPSRFPKAGPTSNAYNYSYGVLLVAVLSFQIWFWATRVDALKEKSCVQYGFLFTKIVLHSKDFKILNLVYSSVVLLLVVGTCFVRPFLRLCRKGNSKSTDLEVESTQYSHTLVLYYRTIDTVFKVLVACIIVTATELCIHWNAIPNVNSIDSVGQTIPLVISIGTVVHMLYISWQDTRNSSNNTSFSRPRGEHHAEAWHHMPRMEMD
ncbi:hypothetical protein BDV95DRAFT_598690 [Massariosphaeria phaeospora]|uniref:Uncharacterized protein n=1 Tax=Massariosphaeria phaeospora TaxID=100035 RepID=A0A7C8M8T7_9PLEO|nr:hypothetical protein BDV95DRAFT_598690 [Massariosphaeria phaeospora]